MSTLQELFTEIAREHLGLETLEERRRDSLDFHDVGVVGVRRALEAAYRAGQAELLIAAQKLLEVPIPVAHDLPPATRAAFQALHRAVQNAQPPKARSGQPRCAAPAGCQRCRATGVPLTMSRFNTQMICLACEEKEQAHPAYAAAAQAERDAVRRGDLNFPGIGKPADL